MSVLAATLKLDVRLQARSKLYVIGIVVSLMSGLIGRFMIGPRYASVALPILYLLSLGGTTYVFGASTVIAEKSQGTLRALRTSPLTVNAYLASKLLTLTAFAGLEGALLHAVGFGGVAFNPLPLVAGVLVLGSLYTLLGMGQVASQSSFTAFLFPGAMLVTMVAQLPALSAFDIGPTALWYCVPTQGPFLLIRAAFQPLATWQWIYAVTMSSVTIVALAWWARRRFIRLIGLQVRR